MNTHSLIGERGDGTRRSYCTGIGRKQTVSVGVCTKRPNSALRGCGCRVSAQMLTASVVVLGAAFRCSLKAQQKGGRRRDCYGQGTICYHLLVSPARSKPGEAGRRRLQHGRYNHWIGPGNLRRMIHVDPRHQSTTARNWRGMMLLDRLSCLVTFDSLAAWKRAGG